MTKVRKYTVGERMEVWSEDYAKLNVRSSSHQTYRGYIDNHVKPNIRVRWQISPAEMAHSLKLPSK